METDNILLPDLGEDLLEATTLNCSVLPVKWSYPIPVIGCKKASMAT